MNKFSRSGRSRDELVLAQPEGVEPVLHGLGNRRVVGQGPEEPLLVVNVLLVDAPPLGVGAVWVDPRASGASTLFESVAPYLVVFAFRNSQRVQALVASEQPQPRAATKRRSRAHPTQSVEIRPPLFMSCLPLGTSPWLLPPSPPCPGTVLPWLTGIAAYLSSSAQSLRLSEMPRRASSERWSVGGQIESVWASYSLSAWATAPCCSCSASCTTESCTPEQTYRRCPLARRRRR